MKITCEINEYSNHLGIFEGNESYPTIVIPNDLIDKFIKLLQEHSGSSGDAITFSLDLLSGEVEAE